MTANGQSSNFLQPQKLILTKEQLEAFQAGSTHATIVTYIRTLNDAVVGVKLRDQCEESDGVKAIIGVLERVEGLARKTPPVDNKASRFGNPAFRTFYDKVGEASIKLHKTLPGLPHDAVPELTVYFREAWGNRARIDYGSGMELNFLCWLICLEKLGIVSPADHKALTVRVFWRYVEVMRVLQSTYWLEPAGSHGVWGLDDYHFLPFLFGSAQLKGHKYIRPKSIHDKDIVDEFSKDYMYLACIKFIDSVKSASLRWHSPMLDDISAVKTWDKVNEGMQKMYLAEVLGKLPVMQHFLFGSLLAWDGPAPPEHSANEDDAHHGHAHALPGTMLVNGKVIQGVRPQADAGAAGQQETGWGDCCGIPVPSVFAAAQAEKEKVVGGGLKLEGRGIRPVPFD